MCTKMNVTLKFNCLLMGCGNTVNILDFLGGAMHFLSTVVDVDW